MQELALVDATKVEIREMRTAADAEAFRALNEEWITKYFALEDADQKVLADPETAIIGKGGRIFVVEADGATVGCVALIPQEHEGEYELSKMAVSPVLRGLGIGRRLIEYAVVQARAMGATRLVLGSNTKLANAVHLYESVGFQHVPKELQPVSPYARADVYTEMVL